MVEKKTVTAREQVMKAMESLPTDATIEDAMDELLYLLKVQQGLEDIDEGRTLSHDEAVRQMAKWRK